MWLFMIGHSIYQLAVLLVLVFAGDRLFDQGYTIEGKVTSV